jgi:type I restriction enzyme S subunit
MKKYEEYKDSGIDWIGEIPTEWCISKIGHYFNIQLGKMLQPKKLNEEDTLEEYLCAINIDEDGLKLETIKEMWFSFKEKETYAVNCGDLLVVEGGNVGLSAIYNGELENCYIQNALHRVKSSKKSINKFLKYWLDFLKNRGYIDLVCNKATIAHFTKDKFTNSVIAVPPFSTQQVIVVYLDRKTAGIDTLIADKQKLIDLLREKRQATINEAVTKGLDKTAKMKDSGIEWIGQIPEDWKTKKLKYLLQDIDGIKIGPFGSSLKLEHLTDSGGYKVYGQENLINEDFSIGNKFISNNKYSELIVYSIFENDILISMMGTIGRCCLVPRSVQQGIMDSHLTRMRTNGQILPQYLSRIINNSRYIMNQLEYNSKGSIMSGLNSGIIKALDIALPPIQEQQIVLEYIDNKTAQIDSLISDITEQIEELKEYRQSIISEVVTGKVAV